MHFASTLDSEFKLKEEFAIQTWKFTSNIPLPHQHGIAKWFLLFICFSPELEVDGPFFNFTKTQVF